MDDKKLREIEELIRDTENNGASLVNLEFASALIAEVHRLQGEGDELREVIDKLTSNHADETLKLMGENARLQAELDAAKERGEWVQGVEHDYSGEDCDETFYVDCSICGQREWHYDIESETCKPPNFCSNCGANMKGK